MARVPPRAPASVPAVPPGHCLAAGGRCPRRPVVRDPRVATIGPPAQQPPRGPCHPPPPPLPTHPPLARVLPPPQRRPESASSGDTLWGNPMRPAPHRGWRRPRAPHAARARRPRTPPAPPPPACAHIFCPPPPPATRLCPSVEPAGGVGGVSAPRAPPPVDGHPKRQWTVGPPTRPHPLWVGLEAGRRPVHAPLQHAPATSHPYRPAGWRADAQRALPPTPHRRGCLRGGDGCRTTPHSPRRVERPFFAPL